MKYALLFGEKILPEKGMKAECPCCMKEVLSKCGQVNEWHWAHVQKEGCNYFERSETEWHRFHKSKFSKESNEVRFISKSGEIHIADVFNEDTVFEFQHSSISYGEVLSRTQFYTEELQKKMVWIFDYTEKESIDIQRWKLGKGITIKKFRRMPEFFNLILEQNCLVIIHYTWNEYLLMLDSNLAVSLDQQEALNPFNDNLKKKVIDIQKFVYKNKANQTYFEQIKREWIKFKDRYDYAIGEVKRNNDNEFYKSEMYARAKKETELLYIPQMQIKDNHIEHLIKLRNEDEKEIINLKLQIQEGSKIISRVYQLESENKKLLHDIKLQMIELEKAHNERDKLKYSRGLFA